MLPRFVEVTMLVNYAALLSACPTTVHIRHGGIVSVDGKDIYCPYRAGAGERCSRARHVCMCYPHAFQDTYDYCVVHSGIINDHCCDHWRKEWYCNSRWLEVLGNSTTTPATGENRIEFFVETEDDEPSLPPSTPRPSTTPRFRKIVRIPRGRRAQ
ncbi:uncharacterized protein LOC129595048 [Paramacrobiotus metropolitanus]|uniref:uncharacterized protein LOC129595048 n=1 Tax=Paramacrobiotus metropolitanus TaxID=2943436 RepID=UPI002445E11B|nr:uncharacterized protein LOC129595048 [Paramacrobiotus metropolitanus]